MRSPFLFVMLATGQLGYPLNDVTVMSALRFIHHLHLEGVREPTSAWLHIEQQQVRCQCGNRSEKYSRSTCTLYIFMALRIAE